MSGALRQLNDNINGNDMFRATKVWNEILYAFYVGIPMKKHRKNMRCYKHCFVASEAVDWLQHYLSNSAHFERRVSRSQALNLLHKYLKSSLLESVTGSRHEFRDDKHLYRFTQHLHQHMYQYIQQHIPDITITKTAVTPKQLKPTNDSTRFTVKGDHFERQSEAHSIGHSVGQSVVQFPSNACLQHFYSNNSKARDRSSVTFSQLSYEQLMVEHLRMSGIYWTITALQLMQFDFNTDAQQNVLSLIRCCVDSKGGVSASVGHDPHILYTLSAIQIIAELNAFDHNIIDTDKTVSYISSLQRSDGSFSGDMWGEVDVRFSFCAIASLALLKRLNAIDLRKAVDFIMQCRNAFDGGFGCLPGKESHVELIYCCLASLAIAGELDRIDADQLGSWLAERQSPSGGLSDRKEELPDLCHSWWVLASLAIIGRLHWIDKRTLTRFILACQDESGGFSDRPGNLVDPFHTLFGVASLSLLAHYCFDDEFVKRNNGDFDEYDQINGQLETIRDTVNVVNPVFCLSQSVIDSVHLWHKSIRRTYQRSSLRTDKRRPVIRETAILSERSTSLDDLAEEIFRRETLV